MPNAEQAPAALPAGLFLLDTRVASGTPVAREGPLGWLRSTRFMASTRIPKAVGRQQEPALEGRLGAARQMMRSRGGSGPVAGLKNAGVKWSRGGFQRANQDGERVRRCRTSIRGGTIDGIGSLTRSVTATSIAGGNTVIEETRTEVIPVAA